MKPLIEIRFTDRDGQEVFSYTCDLQHLINHASTPDKYIHEEELAKDVRDKVIADKDLDDNESEYIDRLIEESRDSFIDGYKSSNKEISRSAEEIEDRVSGGSYEWKIKKIYFDKHTILRDIVEYGNNSTFTSKSFKYTGDNRVFEVSGNNVRISEIDKSAVLRTLDVDWERYETVGTVISRARRQYDTANS